MASDTQAPKKLETWTIASRNRRALLELEQRGLLRAGALPPGLRLAMSLFPRLRVPHYDDRLAYSVILGLMFGLPMGGVVALILAMDGQYSPWWAVLAGIFTGLVFGVVYTAFLAAVHERLGLTPWEELDEPPASDKPDASEEYRKMVIERTRFS